MNLTALLATYGYLALFIGTFLEGETILIIAGFAAYNGHLSLPLAILAARTHRAEVDEALAALARAVSDLT